MNTEATNPPEKQTHYINHLDKYSTMPFRASKPFMARSFISVRKKAHCFTQKPNCKTCTWNALATGRSHKKLSVPSVHVKMNFNSCRF